ACCAMATIESVAYRGGATPPPPEVVHRVHERYLLEVVEALGLCPFARRSRLGGRVHRPVFWVDADGPSPQQVAGVLADRAARMPCAEIVLLTFVGSREPFVSATAFDDFVARVRE